MIMSIPDTSEDEWGFWDMMKILKNRIKEYVGIGKLSQDDADYIMVYLEEAERHY